MGRNKIASNGSLWLAVGVVILFASQSLDKKNSYKQSTILWFSFWKIFQLFFQVLDYIENCAYLDYKVFQTNFTWYLNIGLEIEIWKTF